jgi:hypothetical protein
MMDRNPARSRTHDIRFIALVAFCLAAPLLIAFRAVLPGMVAWMLSFAAATLTRDGAFLRRLGVLLICIAILAVAPINTDTSTSHFIALAIPFFLVIAGPGLFLGRTDPGVIRFQMLPHRFRWPDMFYVLISIPLSWLVFRLYFGIVNPDVPGHWHLPAQPNSEAIWRLFLGINCVGIWDELFFVNTVYAVLRSVFPYRLANAAQAVVYATVLYRMAFTGIGPPIIYIFALTQGTMIEQSKSLLYILIVHLIVDVFLFASIMGHHYPGMFLRHF